MCLTVVNFAITGHLTLVEAGLYADVLGTYFDAAKLTVMRGRIGSRTLVRGDWGLCIMAVMNSSP
jgi:hypothetical protein